MLFGVPAVVAAVEAGAAPGESSPDRTLGVAPPAEFSPVARTVSENTIVIAPGANDALTTEALGGPEGLRALIQGAGALLLQLEIPVRTYIEAAENARQLAVPVVLNAAPCPSERTLEMDRLLQLIGVLIVNETEALALSGGQGPTALRKLGPSVAVVTLGSQGACADDGAGPISVAGFSVASIDAVGAGDTFCGQFALSYRC